jgi:hypothetical protein
MIDEFINLYKQIYKKYELDLQNENYSDNFILNIDKFINKLSYNYDNNKVIKNDYIVYLSNRLSNFLINNDYKINNIIYHYKLFNKICNIINHKRFFSIKNIDQEIYNDLLFINKNYIDRNQYINKFILKYTTKKIRYKIII